MVQWFDVLGKGKAAGKDFDKAKDLDPSFTLKVKA